MKTNKKYMVAVTLLAVLAVVFGFAGTVMPASDLGLPQQAPSSSDSVAHFQNPPTYDSDWMDITDKNGQYFNITHNLNSTDIIVDITGKTTIDGGAHQKHLGLTGYTPGWSRTYGGTGNDQVDGAGMPIIQTSDGGYAMVGSTNSFGAGGYDFWLVKTDWTGNVQWSKTYGGTDNDYGYSVIQTGDGGYAIVGQTASSGAGGDDGWLVKTDASGNLLWNKTYGGSSGDFWTSVIQTSDGGYALGGYTMSFGLTKYQFWLLKTDSTGNEQWNQKYGGSDVDLAKSMIQTSDAGYALAGYRFAGSNDFQLLKTDSAGTQEWIRQYGGGNHDTAFSVIQTSDGGYALIGATLSFGSGGIDCWLVKTDSTGIMQWSETYGGTGDDYGYSVIQTVDGGYVLAGSTSSYGAGGRDFWLVRTNPAGNMLWNRIFGGIEDDRGVSLILTTDGGYAIAAETQSYGAGLRDLWLVKTDVESGLAWTDSTADNITLYRGTTDIYWNYVRVRIWIIEEPTWQFGDINQDGVVDAQDLYILGRNYGKTFSLLSLGGIVAVAGFHQYKKRIQPK